MKYLLITAYPLSTIKLNTQAVAIGTNNPHSSDGASFKTQAIALVIHERVNHREQEGI